MSFISLKDRLRIFFVASISAMAFLVPAKAVSAEEASDRDTYALARDAYLYAYPIVTMDTRIRQTPHAPHTHTCTHHTHTHTHAYTHARINTLAHHTTHTHTHTQPRHTHTHTHTRQRP